ncbi:MAG: cupin domain-containing protein [Ignavibacteriae bacterium]|nr:cupin domain-containing protein [Ignavibacteriota bacterium]
MDKLPRFCEFDKMPMEKMNDKISRRYVYGVHVMLVFFDFKKGAIIPEHHHESEQITYIIKGKVRVFSGDKKFVVSKGEVLVIPPNVLHRFEALEDTFDIDVFSPLRRDWLEGTDNYLKQK